MKIASASSRVRLTRDRAGLGLLLAPTLFP